MTSLVNAVADSQNETFAELWGRLRGYLTDPPVASRGAPVERAELDLHLQERGSRYEHETRAYEFGQFVAGAAQVANDLVRAGTGLARHPRSLHVVGGPQAGSVQVVLREPAADPLDEQDSLFPRGESVEARALLTLTQILNAAEASTSDPQNEILPPLLDVGVAARRSITRLARVMVAAGWVTRGHLSLPNRDPLTVEISLAGAHLLRTTATERLTRVRNETHHGTIDGWIWSSAELQIITDHGRRMRLAVPAPLQLEVARLNAEKDQRVTADVQVVESTSRSGQTMSRSYALVHVYPDARLPLAP